MCNSNEAGKKIRTISTKTLELLSGVAIGPGTTGLSR